jgi:hypothetical protein
MIELIAKLCFFSILIRFERLKNDPVEVSANYDFGFEL